MIDAARPAFRWFTQLVISLPTGKGGPFEAFPVGDSEASDYDERRPALHTSRGQEPLFTSRRDWAPVLARLRTTPAGEPPLTATARRLVEDFTRGRPGQRPDYRKNTRTLTILLYWLGADTAIFERDVYDLARIDVNLAAKPVCHFLRIRGLLVEDPDLHRDADHVWIVSALAALPEPVASEVRTWVKVMREQGPREGELRGYDGIRHYLSNIQPALTAWTTTAGVTSLREITKDQVEDAVDGMSGYARRGLATALRSLFRALKREGEIFRNPRPEPPGRRHQGHPEVHPHRPPDGAARPGDDTARPTRRGPRRHSRATRQGDPNPPHHWSGPLPRHPRSTARPAAPHPLPGGAHPPTRRRQDDLPPPALAGLVQPPPCWSDRRPRSTPTTRPSASAP